MLMLDWYTDVNEDNNFNLLYIENFIFHLWIIFKIKLLYR